MEPKTDHDWPTEQDAHMWGPWASHTNTPKVKKVYRQCVHPDCGAFEIRDAARA